MSKTNNFFYYINLWFNIFYSYNW